MASWPFQYPAWSAAAVSRGPARSRRVPRWVDASRLPAEQRCQARGGSSCSLLHSTIKTGRHTSGCGPGRLRGWRGRSEGAQETGGPTGLAVVLLLGTRKEQTQRRPALVVSAHSTPLGLTGMASCVLTKHAEISGDKCAWQWLTLRPHLCKNTIFPRKKYGLESGQFNEGLTSYKSCGK